MKRIILFSMLLLAAGLTAVNAQLRKIPAEVTEAFKAKYPNTKNAEWSDKLTSFQVDYEMDGARYASRFSNKGEWEQTEKEITQSGLPAAVKDGFSKSKYTTWELKTVTWIESREGGVQYRLFVRKSTVEKRDLFFDRDGRLLKDNITL